VTAPSTLGAYRFIAELGHGGMADVYLAASEGPAGSGFTKLAVVKLLRSAHAEDPDFVSMLMDEARVTARLAHPNVVQLFEVGHLDGQYFLAMEFLEGQPLHRVARRIQRTNGSKGAGASIPSDVLYAVVSDVLAGLHHAHELADYDGTPLKVVHRDVTPHNVFVTYDGVVKVVDFGIAKAAGRLTETMHGVVKGKVRYMSPEQAACRDVDRRTDVFAAGVMLWNLATGTKFWGERTDAEVAQALFKGTYEASPRALFPDVPVEIDAICKKALSHRREDRYETAAAMRADIEAFLAERSVEARKTLSASMKEIFTSERAKLRKVLETSALTTAPSVDVFAARAREARLRRKAARASRPSMNAPAAEHTKVMADAPRIPRAPRTPQRPPVSEEPSLAPMSVAPGFVAPAPKPGSSRDRAKDAPRPKKRASNTWAYALAALAVVICFATFATRVPMFGGDVDLSPRQVARVASDLTTISHAVRLKVAHADDAVDPTSHGHVTASSQAAAAAQTQSTTPASVVTAAEPPAPHTGRRAPRGGNLDSADPWSAVRP
jgi:serine/threonine-protein kinase